MEIDFPYSPLPPPKKSPDLGGDLAGGGGGDAPGGALHGSGEEEWEGGGGRGPARAQVMRLSRQPRLARQTSCRASACGTTEVPRHCPVSAAVAQRCTERQRGSPVAPYALALVAPGALARPNGLRGTNIP